MSDTRTCTRRSGCPGCLETSHREPGWVLNLRPLGKIEGLSRTTATLAGRHRSGDREDLDAVALGLEEGQRPDRVPLDNLGFLRRFPLGLLQLYRNVSERLPIVSDDFLMTPQIQTMSSPCVSTMLKRSVLVTRERGKEVGCAEYRGPRQPPRTALSGLPFFLKAHRTYVRCHSSELGSERSGRVRVRCRGEKSWGCSTGGASRSPRVASKRQLKRPVHSSTVRPHRHHSRHRDNKHLHRSTAAPRANPPRRLRHLAHRARRSPQLGEHPAATVFSSCLARSSGSGRARAPTSADGRSPAACSILAAVSKQPPGAGANRR